MQDEAQSPMEARKWSPVGRTPYASLLALAAAAAIVAIFSDHYPIREWLMVVVAQYWLFAIYWAVACLGLGLWLLSSIFRARFAYTERIVLAFPLGVLGFVLITFATGLAGQLGRVFFWASPLALIVLGRRQLSQAYKGAIRISRTILKRRLTATDCIIVLFGVAGLVAVYLPILTPQNVQHDARWYHLPLAQQYASSGKIAPFEEGWFLATYPQLASLIYTWALLWPASIVHRIGLCAHVEYVAFLATLGAMPVAFRRILPRSNGWLSWSATFLFPGLFVYDSNLSTGADHIAAIWALPGLLAWLAARRCPAPDRYALLGAFAGGAALTKYSALDVAIPLVLASLTPLPSGAATDKLRVRKVVMGAMACGLAFVVVTAAHWLKNYIWHGDPAYPLFHNYLHSHPWSARSSGYFLAFTRDQIQRPEFSVSALIDSLIASVTIGFKVREYPFHGEIPTFGFLFAATLPIALALKPPRKLVAVYAFGVFGAFVWFWTNQRDRYLQACLPWFVVAAAVTIYMLWQERQRLARVATSVLVGAQLVCGAGVCFISTHVMIPEHHPLPYVRRLIAAGYDGKYEERFQPYEDWEFRSWVMLGKRLPPHSKVLVHEDRLWLGIDAPVVVDEAAWQAGIDYGTAQTTSGIYDILTRHGATHVITGRNHPGGGDHGLLGDVLFWGFLRTNCEFVAKEGNLSMWALPRSRPPEVGRSVVITACNAGVQPGLYKLSAGAPPMMECTVEQCDQRLLSTADFIVIEDGCVSQVPLAGADKLVKRNDVTIFSRLPQEHF